ncbi:MAG TPA: hypothetical protein V6D18_20895 [Thermosynechococcaceae cyanobacterium]
MLKTNIDDRQQKFDRSAEQGTIGHTLLTRFDLEQLQSWRSALIQAK